MSYYEKPFKVDQLASDVEDFLTKCSVIPIIGTIPAIIKVGFGIIQTTCAALTFVGSTFFLMSESGRTVWLHSLRHMLHGLSNILAGIIQAIPIVGTIIALSQMMNGAATSDYMVHYSNAQSHKFFAYKTLEDTSWVKSSFDAADTHINKEDIPKDGAINAARFSI